MKRSLELAAATQQNLLPARPPVLEHSRSPEGASTATRRVATTMTSSICPRRMAVAWAWPPGRERPRDWRSAAHGCHPRYAPRRRRAPCARPLIHDPGLNARLARDAVDGQFITLFYGILQDRTRSLTWSPRVTSRPSGHAAAARTRTWPTPGCRWASNPGDL